MQDLNLYIEGDIEKAQEQKEVMEQMQRRDRKLREGTRFELVLPLTTAVTQVVMLRTDKLSFGVPANLVELVRRAKIALHIRE